MLKLSVFALVGAVWLVGSFVAPAARAADVVQDLPAGGTYVFQTKWDRYTIRCTSNPVTPTVLARSCACTTYYQYDHYVYRLSAKLVLSNGQVTDMPLAENLETLDLCHHEESLHQSVCAASGQPVPKGATHG